MLIKIKYRWLGSAVDVIKAIKMEKLVGIIYAMITILPHKTSSKTWKCIGQGIMIKATNSKDNSLNNLCNDYNTSSQNFKDYKVGHENYIGWGILIKATNSKENKIIYVVIHKLKWKWYKRN